MSQRRNASGNRENAPQLRRDNLPALDGCGETGMISFRRLSHERHELDELGLDLAQRRQTLLRGRTARAVVYAMNPAAASVEDGCILSARRRSVCRVLPFLGRQ